MTGRKKKKRRKKNSQNIGYFYDFNLLAAVILLLSFGLVMLYSASAYESVTTFGGKDSYYFSHQTVYAVIALAGAVIVSLLDYHKLIKWTGALYFVSLVMLAMVKYSPLGYAAYGAKRWLRIGPLSIQPAEISKVALILFLPYVMIRMGRKLKKWRAQALVMMLGMAQAIGAWVLTQNLSTGIILGLLTIVLLLLGVSDLKIHKRVLGVGFVLLVLAGIFVRTHPEVLIAIENLPIVQKIGGFRFGRILEWSQGGSDQILQGLYAIGSGGFRGKGLGNSTQKINTIPEAQNDMIFAIICEELGVFGAILLLVLFGYLLYRLFCIAQNAPDSYGFMIVSGVFAHIAIQVILNLCVVLNVIPATGITLPFVSYGGTSLLFMMVEIGIALSVSRQITFKDQESIEESGKNVLTNG